jgi:hypothetical protein
VGVVGTTIPFDVSIDFTPIEVLKYDKGGAYSGIGGSTAAMNFSVASRYSSDDLTNFVGRYLRKVEFYINDTLKVSNLTVNVWKGGSFGNGGTQIYSKDVTSQIQYNNWTTHTLDQAIKIEAGQEYWVGYTILEPKKVYAAAIDRGPMKPGKGAWLLSSGTWSQLKDLNSSLDYNFMVRGIVETTATDVKTVEQKQNLLVDQNYPNPFSSSTTFRFKTNKPGHITINIYNSIGQLIDIAVDKDYDGENHEVNYSGAKLNSGIYYYTLVYKEKGTSAAPITHTRKMSVIR